VQVSASGIPWYKREDYSEILKVMDDANLLPRDFDSWLKKAEQVKKQLKARGIVPIEAYINPSEFPAWCRARSLNVNAAARLEYANFVAFKSYQQGKA